MAWNSVRIIAGGAVGSLLLGLVGGDRLPYLSNRVLLANARSRRIQCISNGLFFFTAAQLPNFRSTTSTNVHDPGSTNVLSGDGSCLETNPAERSSSLMNIILSLMAPILLGRLFVGGTAPTVLLTTTAGLLLMSNCPGGLMMVRAQTLPCESMKTTMTEGSILFDGLFTTAISDEDWSEQDEQLHFEWQVRRQTLGPAHVDTLSALTELACWRYGQGKVDEAEPLFVEALTMRRSSLGDDHPDTLAAMNRLANVWHAQGRLDEAKPLFLAAYDGNRKKEVDVLYPTVLPSFHYVAVWWIDQGRFDEAEDFYKEALDVGKRLVGDRHPETRWARAQLAQLRRQRRLQATAVHAGDGAVVQEPDRLDKARPQPALDAEAAAAGQEREQERSNNNQQNRQQPPPPQQQQQPPPVAPETTIAAFQAIALLRSHQGRAADAELLYEEAVEVGWTKMGPRHVETLEALSALANFIAEQDDARLDDADPLFVAALAGYRDVLGDDHPDTLAAMNNVATLRHIQGRFDEAGQLYEPVLAAARTVHGDRHVDTLSLITDLANLRAAQGRRDEAKALYEEALVGYREALGEQHPNTRMVEHNLAGLLSSSSAGP